MDQSLDDIIKQQRGSGRGRGAGRGRGGGRGATSSGRGFSGRRGGFGLNKARAISTFARGSSRTPQGQWQHDRFNEYDNGGGGRFNRSSDSAGGSATTKLIISNLDFGVSDSDVKELFTEFGPLKRAAVHYDKAGRSLGSAEVIFERKTDAVRAMKQYNNVPLDGRAMKIQLIGANSAASSPAGAAALGSRLGAAAGTRRGGLRGRGRGAGGRGGRGSGGGGRGGRQPKETLTAEQLDADLDAYVNKVDAE